MVLRLFLRRRTRTSRRRIPFPFFSPPISKELHTPRTIEAPARTHNPDYSPISFIFFVSSRGAPLGNVPY